MSKNKYFYGLGILLPMVLFYGFVYQNALNIPFQDDIDGVYGALQDLIQSPTWSDKIKIFFQQDDEHRVLFDRLVTWGLYQTTGEVSLRSHILIGTALILGLFFLLFRGFQKLQISTHILIPIPWFIFQIQYHEGIFWGMIPNQNFAVLFFAVLAFYWLSKPTWRYWILAALAGLLATFSSGNGMICLLTGLLLLLYQKRWKHLIVWAVLSIGGIYFYFKDLVIPAFRPKLSDNLVQYPSTILADFPAFLGQYFDPGEHYPLIVRGLCSILPGILLLLFLGWMGYSMLLTSLKKRPNDNPEVAQTLGFLMASAIFVIGTAAAFSITRAGDGFVATFTSRYKLSVAFLWALTYGLLYWSSAQRYKRYIFAGGLMISVFVNVAVYFQQIDRVLNFRKTLLTDAFSWQHGRNLPSSPIYFHLKNKADSTLLFHLTRGSYEFPADVFSGFFENKKIRQKILKDSTSFNIQKNETTDHITFLSQDYTWSGGQDAGLYILFHSENESHLFATRQKRFGIRPFLLKGQYYASGFVSDPILKKALARGTYRVFWVDIGANKRRIFDANQSVTIKESIK
jgi:hypothetical protein